MVCSLRPPQKTGRLSLNRTLTFFFRLVSVVNIALKQIFRGDIPARSTGSAFLEILTLGSGRDSSRWSVNTVDGFACLGTRATHGLDTVTPLHRIGINMGYEAGTGSGSP